MTTGSNLPPEVLERQAAEQRGRIADSITELKESVRERLDVNVYARKHMGGLASIASLFAFAAGYAVAGIFTRR